MVVVVPVVTKNTYDCYFEASPLPTEPVDPENPLACGPAGASPEFGSLGIASDAPR